MISCSWGFSICLCAHMSICLPIILSLWLALWILYKDMLRMPSWTKTSALVTLNLTKMCSVWSLVSGGVAEGGWTRKRMRGVGGGWEVGSEYCDMGWMYGWGRSEEETRMRRILDLWLKRGSEILIKKEGEWERWTCGEQMKVPVSQLSYRIVLMRL